MRRAAGSGNLVLVLLVVVIAVLGLFCARRAASLRSTAARESGPPRGADRAPPAQRLAPGASPALPASPRGPVASPPLPPAHPPASAPARTLFRDVTREAKIRFVHSLGGKLKYHFSVYAGGVAVGDFNGDGRPDLYFVNSADPWEPEKGEPNELYRNNGDGTFTEVAAQAGVADRGLGMGAVFADYDNDGFDDLYVTKFTPKVLYRNRGDGTFTDATAGAGVGGSRLSFNAAFADFDLDGDLDLYVANDKRYDYRRNTFEHIKTMIPVPSGGVPPASLKELVARHLLHNRSTMEPNELFRNEGDGTFTEVAHRTGVENWGGNGMGLLFMDVNRDGWPDIFIANDNTPNTLLLNHGGKRFEDVSAAAGVDDARGSMGCTAGDYDNDGDLEIFYGNSYTQGIALLKSRLDRKHPFRIAYSDIVARARIADVSREYTQWGCVFLDYDNDGFLDLFFVNGGLTLLHDWETLTPEPYYLLHNEGDGTFADVTAGCGEALQGLHQGKGVAVLDYDGDGNCDLVINHLAAPAALLRNEGGHGNNWLELSLVGTACNRNAVGARITVAAGDLVQCRVVSCGDSYLGCSSRTSHFGLGKHGKADLVEIAWPDGKVQRLRDVQPNRLVTVRQP